MNLNNLQIFLDKNEIPKIKKKPKTFLGIAKQPHYENVLSNIYAFFFNVNEEHKMGRLFIDSLIELIKEAVEKKEVLKKDFSGLDKFKIETEFGTKGKIDPKTGELKKGRIDLLLYNKTSAIIIENKVYHYLKNDLDDYWESVINGKLTENQIGIILSLNPVSKDNYKQYTHKKEYINITHLQLMKRVMSNKEESLENVSIKYVVFLEDFNQNIMNISKPFMEENDLKFYLDNQKKINELESFKKGVYQHIVSEIEKAGEGLDNFDLNSLRKTQFNNNRLRYYESKVHPELMITVLFEGLLNGANSLKLIIEMRGELLKEPFKSELTSVDATSIKHNMVSDNYFKEDSKSDWAHFASREYLINTVDLARLSQYIIERLKQDNFLDVFKKLEEKLNDNK